MSQAISANQKNSLTKKQKKVQKIIRDVLYTNYQFSKELSVRTVCDLPHDLSCGYQDIQLQPSEERHSRVKGLSD